MTTEWAIEILSSSLPNRKAFGRDKTEWELQHFLLRVRSR
jgi:hypothetical protein